MTAATSIIFSWLHKLICYISAALQPNLLLNRETWFFWQCPLDEIPAADNSPEWKRRVRRSRFVVGARENGLGARSNVLYAGKTLVQHQMGSSDCGLFAIAKAEVSIRRGCSTIRLPCDVTLFPAFRLGICHSFPAPRGVRRPGQCMLWRSACTASAGGASGREGSLWCLAGGAAVWM